MGKLTYNGVPWEEAKHLFELKPFCCCCGNELFTETCDFCQGRVCLGCYHFEASLIKCNLCTSEEQFGILIPRMDGPRTFDG